MKVIRAQVGSKGRYPEVGEVFFAHDSGPFLRIRSGDGQGNVFSFEDGGLKWFRFFHPTDEYEIIDGAFVEGASE